LKKLGQFKDSTLLPQQKAITELGSKIHAIKDINSFMQTCGDDGHVESFAGKNNIERIIAAELKIICKVRFIESLLTSKKFKSLAALEKKFFESNIRFYLLKDRTHLLKRYLNILEQDSKIHKYFMNLLN